MSDPESNQAAPASPYHVLLVDDEPEVRTALANLVSGMGYETDSASGGEEALEKLDGAAYDLVITDLVMPGMSGWNLLRRIKQMSPGLPVVVITGYIPENSEEMLSSAQADGYLVKPIDATDLGILLKALLFPQNLGRSAKAVIVDDEADDLDAMRSSLERRGITCEGYREAGEAVDRIVRRPPNIVILDQMLPGMSGLDAAKRIRDAAATRHLPILMISSNPTPDVVQRAVTMRVNGFVAKPFDPKALGDRVIQILRQNPA